MRTQWIFSPAFSPIVVPFIMPTLAFALLTSCARAQSCTATDADRAMVADTVRTMYAGASVDDVAKVHSVAAPSFYAFDGGMEYSSIDALMTVVKSYQDQGVKFVWTVTKPKVTIHCDEAWISYDQGKDRFVGGFSVSGFESIALGIGAQFSQDLNWTPQYDLRVKVKSCGGKATHRQHGIRS